MREPQHQCETMGRLHLETGVGDEHLQAARPHPKHQFLPYCDAPAQIGMGEA